MKTTKITGLDGKEVLIQDGRRFYKLIPFKDYVEVEDLMELLGKYDVRLLSNSSYRGIKDVKWD